MLRWLDRASFESRIPNPSSQSTSNSSVSLTSSITA